MAYGLALLAPPCAFAELTEESQLGAGAMRRPAYDGSASDVTQAIPLVRYLGDPWFVRTTQDVLEGGVRAPLAPGVHAGAQLAYEPGRYTSESDFLMEHRVPDVDRSASAGVHVEWDHMIGPMPLNLLLRARQNMDLAQGGQVDLRFSAGVLRAGPVSAGIFTQATWADAKSADSFYGISPEESRTSGLPAFRAGSGLMETSYGCVGSVDLSSKWTVVFSLESHRLQGDSAHSPIAERLTNFYATVGPAYRF